MTTIAEVGAGVATFSDTKVKPTQTYWYRVFATNDNGNSLFSNTTQPVRPLGSLALRAHAMQQGIWDFPLNWLSSSAIQDHYE